MAGQYSLSYLPLALYGLRGNAQAVLALELSWLVTMLSKGIGPEFIGGGAGRTAAVAIIALATIFRSGALRGDWRMSRPVQATLGVGFFLVCHSLLFSRVADVSVLKALSWTVTTCTLLANFGRLSDGVYAQLERIVFGLLLGVSLVSLPLVATEVGYLTNGTGFQGILNQPQAFGLTMALLASWLLGGLLGDPRPSWQRLAFLGVAIMMVALSQSRTAGLAFLLSVPIGVLLVVRGAPGSARASLPGLWTGRMHWMLLLAPVVLALTGTALLERMSTFLRKGEDATSIVQSYDTSRGRLVERMLSNIKMNPWAGIGFGVASDPYAMVIERDSVLGMPTGAAIEKGNTPIAVVEELGVLGALVVAAWLVVLALPAIRGGPRPAIVLVAILLTNLGEATLFSPGGFGMLALILIAWAATSRHPPVQRSAAHA